MEFLSDPAAWSALAALLTLEIVLGIDNVVFISILASKLLEDQQDRARRTGIVAAGGMRVLLLLAVGWIITLEDDWFELFGKGFSGKDLILLAGGLFLIYKATKEIHERVDGPLDDEEPPDVKAVSVSGVVLQILVLDLVFSIDSVITAVGLTQVLWVLYGAVILSVVMVVTISAPIARWFPRRPIFPTAAWRLRHSRWAKPPGSA